MKDLAVVDESTADFVRAAYERTSGRLWRAVLAWAGSRDIADDAVAEAFAQLLRRGEAVTNPDRWVWTAAFRIAAGELRRRGHDTRLTREVDLIESSGPGATGVAEDLVRALGRLSDQQRACLVLRDIGGLDVSEVAELLHTTAGTVRVQHVRARHRVRRWMEEEDTP